MMKTVPEKRGFEGLLQARADFSARVMEALVARREPEEVARQSAALLAGRAARLKARIAALEAEKAAEMARLDAEIASALADLKALDGEELRVKEMAQALKEDGRTPKLGGKAGTRGKRSKV
jgi:hypothetical protein